jgi:processive 1,2-diacylglycerol beta-glucosyltransferase
VTGRPRHVLILTASYGSGHNRVAETLAAEFERAGATARVVDHFHELVHPVFDDASRSLYYSILRQTPLLWGAAYWLADQPTCPRYWWLNRIGMKLRRLTERPDAVVSVHPTPAAALSELVAAGRRVPPHTTVFTDFVAHTQWIYPHVDRYSSPPTRSRGLMARGYPAIGL